MKKNIYIYLYILKIFNILFLDIAVIFNNIIIYQILFLIDFEQYVELAWPF